VSGSDSTPAAPGKGSAPAGNKAAAKTPSSLGTKLSNMQQMAQSMERSIQQLPEHVGHMGGVTPKMDHGE
jgi:hypothetical protein